MPGRRLRGLSPNTQGTKRLYIYRRFVVNLREVRAFAITPGKPVTRQPGGNHIMPSGLKQPLKSGDSIPLTLHIKESGVIDTQAPVKGLDETPQ